ncbi:hypothetical protein WJX81_005119 [Elliptochloris bilobata]|uniref:Uncharacterized protein n=1 Tax=Elliptochloris bilobata TaxID=381761 RepID=A0AAW1RMK0_9CHLO
MRGTYGRELVKLANEARYTFLNALFSVSEAVMYMQMVDRMDQGLLPAQAEIIQEPAAYAELDPDMARTLLDQKQAGKTLLLITNSDYQCTDAMMSYCYDRFLPQGMRWRDLFDMVVVQARKPDFWAHAMPLYEVVTPDGLMRPAMDAARVGLHCGGSATMVEKALGVAGDDILYVGDHIYTDAALAKINFRWRTALIVRELDSASHLASAACWAAGRPHRPMLEQDGKDFSERWGYLSRAGLNDKSCLMRQIEKCADIYTSRVSNFLQYTPYMYFSVTKG